MKQQAPAATNERVRPCSPCRRRTSEMACIVGITTDPDAHRARCENEYPNVTAWRVVLGPVPRHQAQHSQKRLVRQYRCASGVPEDRPKRPGTMWYVYYFEYGSEQ